MILLSCLDLRQFYGMHERIWHLQLKPCGLATPDCLFLHLPCIRELCCLHSCKHALFLGANCHFTGLLNFVSSCVLHLLLLSLHLDLSLPHVCPNSAVPVLTTAHKVNPHCSLSTDRVSTLIRSALHSEGFRVHPGLASGHMLVSIAGVSPTMIQSAKRKLSGEVLSF